MFRRRQKPMFYTKKRNKFAYVLIFLIIAAILFCGFVVYSDVFAKLRNDGEAVSVYFPPESNNGEIAEILHDSGVITYPAAFRIYKLFNRNAFVCGGHILKKSMTYREIISAVTSEGTGSVAAFVIPEGARLDEITASAKELLDIEKNEFFVSLDKTGFVGDNGRGDKKYEGYLLPGTYTASNSDGLARAFADAFCGFFTDDRLKRCEELNMTADQILILASVIQKEAETPEEMPSLAADLYKKLKNNENLNLQAALCYMLGTEETTQSDKLIDSPYNTFMYAGLPKGAICSPGENALNAALYPKEQ